MLYVPKVSLRSIGIQTKLDSNYYYLLFIFVNLAPLYFVLNVETKTQFVNILQASIRLLLPKYTALAHCRIAIHTADFMV